MNSLSLKRVLIGFLLITGFILSVYFVAVKTPRYFVFTEESYTPYFWTRHNWVIVHVVFGILAVLLGPFQFIPAIRNNYLNVHRWMGRTYLTSTMIGGIAGLYMASTSQVNYTYQSGLTSLALIWITAGTMAYIAIRNLNIKQHREWMIRSYVITFGFTAFRLMDDLLGKAIPDQGDRLGMLSWTCWAVPLLIAEVCIQAGKLRQAQS